MTRVLVVAMAVLLSGCAFELRKEHPLACRTSEQSWMRDALTFGAKRVGGGEVSDVEWAQFERATIAAEFPHGFTVLTGHGHWRDDHGTDWDESNHLLIVEHADDAASEAAIQRVIVAYRDGYAQEAVLRERSAVCVSFNEKR